MLSGICIRIVFVNSLTEVENKMKLYNKTIVLTGGTSGIGLALVKQLHKHNTLIVIARPTDRLNQIKQKYPNVDIYPCDLSLPNNYQAVCDAIVKEHTNIDLLINNAALQHTEQFLSEDFNYESIALEINTNFHAICALSYFLLPALSNSKTSAILNVNSGLGLVPKTSSAVYCATKAAVNAFTMSLRYQLADTQISVMQSFLPLVDTQMTFGRGSGKLSAIDAASEIIKGVEQGKNSNYIGKVKLLRFLLFFAPALARKLMRNY